MLDKICIDVINIDDIDWDEQTNTGDCYMITYIDDLEFQVNYYGKECYSMNVEYCGELIYEKDIGTNIKVEEAVKRLLKKYKVKYKELNFPDELEFEEIFQESIKKQKA